MSEVTTIKIEDGHGGFIRINSTEFDPKIHTLFELPAKPAETSKRTPK